jgi:hypothetical protein
MKLFVLLALGSQITVALADQVPVLNVEPVCRGIAQQAGTDSRDKTLAERKDTCIKGEQEMRDQIARAWSSFTAADKTHCVNLARMGGHPSYTELLTCLEMARDVRKLRAQPPEPPAPRR